MKTTIKWINDMMMVGESASGHAVVMDGPEELGGKNLGIRPMEMLLLGMGGCTTIDVVSTLKKCVKIYAIATLKLLPSVQMNTPKF